MMPSKPSEKGLVRPEQLEVPRAGVKRHDSVVVCKGSLFGQEEFGEQHSALTTTQTS